MQYFVAEIQVRYFLQSQNMLIHQFLPVILVDVHVHVNIIFVIYNFYGQNNIYTNLEKGEHKTRDDDLVLKLGNLLKSWYLSYFILCI
jgi:hypothetical protein